MELEQSKLKDYLHKKARGQLKSTAAEERFAHALQNVTLAPQHDDGFVHFGDRVMLFNQATDGCLACDPQEALGEDKFATTSTWYTEPCARNTFHLMRWEGKGDVKDAMFDFRDDVVHFGQKIQIVGSSELLRAGPAALASYPKTPTSYARYSRNQEVAMTSKLNWSTVWEVQYLDPQYKLEMEGQAVPTNAPVALLHCATHAHLASDVIKYRNDFGTEYEMFCKTFQDITRQQVGVRDKTMLGDCNRWCFVAAIPEEGAAGGGGDGRGGGAEQRPREEASEDYGPPPGEDSMLEERA